MKNDAVFNLLPEEELLAQLAEECSEAAKAALKLRRAVDEDELWCEKCAVGGKKSTSCGFCYGLDGLRIRRPPQSWCYVAEAEEDDAL